LVNQGSLCDIFNFLNNLNLTLQGSNVTVFKVQEKVEAATKKLNLWSRHVEAGNYKAFKNLTELQKEYNMSSMPDEILAAIKEHLLGLKTSLKEHFPPINSNKAWIRNPFTVNVESETELPDSDIESIIELSCDTALKDIFDRIPLMDFWLSCRQEYPVLTEKAIKFLMPFVTTYKCEASFSTLVFLKNKYRNRLEVEPDLKIKLSSFSPNLKFLVNKKQHHISH
jgi:zinc finger BED domain-containing protein 5/7/8/9